MIVTAESGQFCTSTKKVRGLAKKTLALRAAILAAFEETEKPATVRQMFYMLTVRGAVPKTESAGYRPVQKQLVAMRREGLIPYDWISDNTRWMRKPRTYENLSDFLNRSAHFYRQDLWIHSDAYVEVWIEKDALAGVVYPVTERYDVPLMVARGFASESFIYSTVENIRAANKPAYIYHLGDFDPSGWEASLDIKSRLQAFGVDVTFKRLAVHPSQISSWNLPARPTKTTDTRCKSFFNQFGHGTESVELDAIPPNMLRKIVRDAIESHIDRNQLHALETEEASARLVLRQWAESLDSTP